MFSAFMFSSCSQMTESHVQSTKDGKYKCIKYLSVYKFAIAHKRKHINRLNFMNVCTFFGHCILELHV